MFKNDRLFALLGLFLLAASAAPAQAPHAFPFRATNYDVEVMLHPEDQTITALVKVKFVATQVSRTLLVELHPDLRVNSIKTADGKELSFDRDNNSPLLLSVALPGVATPGKEVDLVFDYAGPISSEDDSPTRGVRFASVDKTSAYLLLPARWFPLTNYPANRYTGTFRIIVPDTFVVVGTGKADAPTSMPGIGTRGFVRQFFRQHDRVPRHPGFDRADGRGHGADLPPHRQSDPRQHGLAAGNSTCRRNPRLEHDPEKWKPVFRKDHAPSKC